MYSNFLKAINGFIHNSTSTVEGIIDTACDLEGSIQQRLSLSLRQNISSLFKLSFFGGGRLAWDLSTELLWLPSLYSKYNYFKAYPQLAFLEIIKDEELAHLITNNKELLSNIIAKMLLSGLENNEESRDKIKHHAYHFVDSLAQVVSDIQAMTISEQNNVNSIEKLQSLLLNSLADGRNEHNEILFNHFIHLSKSVMALARDNPKLFKDSFNIMALSPEDELHKQKYQDAAVEILTQARSKELDKDLAQYFENYRESNNISNKSLLDSYVEHYAHNKSLAGIDIVSQDLRGFSFNGFDFRFSKLGAIDFAQCQFKSCDFKYNIFDSNITFEDAQIDGPTFQSMLPSLRQAKAEGIKVNLRNCKILGDFEELDLRGIDIEGINLQNSTIRAIKITSDQQTRIRFQESKPPHIKVFSSYNSNKKEIIERKFLHHFINSVKDKITTSLLESRNEKIVINDLINFLEDKLYNVISENHNAIEQEHLIGILNTNPEIREEFLTSILPDIIKNVKFEAIESSRVWGNTLRAKIDDKRKFENTLEGFISIIKNRGKYKFYDNLENRISGKDQKRLRVITSYPERMAALDNFIMLASNSSVNEFIHYEGNEKPTRFGKFFRRTVESFLPTFLKYLVYPNTKLGKLLQSRSLGQSLKITFKIIKNSKSILEGYRDITPVFDDLNYWSVWKTPEEIKKARIDVIKNIISNKSLRKVSVLLDSNGNPKRDENGRVIPNSLTADFLCSTIDILNNRDDVKKFLAYGYEVLELVEKSNSLNELESLFYDQNISVAELKKQLLLRASKKLDIEEIVKLEQRLEELLPIIKKIGQEINISEDVEEVEFTFPHTETSRKIETLFTKMRQNNDRQGDKLDVGKIIFKGDIVDFSYGVLQGKAYNPLTISNIKANKFNATSSQFTNIRLEQCDLTGYRQEDIPKFLFKGANFDHVKFKQSIIAFSNLSDIYADTTNFERCQLIKTNMPRAVFTNSVMENVTIKECNLEKSNWENMLFSGGKIINSKLKEVNCQKATIEESILENTSFEKASLVNASLWRSNLRNVNFNGADMRGVNLEEASLENCVLRNADLRDVDLKGVKLKGKIDLTGAKITAAQRFYLTYEARKSGAKLNFHDRITYDQDKNRSV